MAGGRETLRETGSIGELREAALRLLEEFENGAPWALDDDPPATRDRMLGELALAADDLELAREIDSAGIRAEVTAGILSERDDVDGLHALIALSGHIEDRTLRDLTVAGLADGATLPAVQPDLAAPVKDMIGGEARDRALLHLAVRGEDPLHFDRISSRPVRIEALGGRALETRSVDLAHRALGEALQESDPWLLAPAAHAAGILGDRGLVRRTVRAASRVDDTEAAVLLFDLLGGCSFRSQYSRYAMRLMRILPEGETDDDGEELWEGTREAPLAHMAIRHRSPGLARRIRGAFFRDSALAGIAISREDPAIAAGIGDSLERSVVLAGLAGRLGRVDLADEAIRLADGDTARLFLALVTKIGILRRSVQLGGA